MSGFPERDGDIQNAESRDCAAKPVRCDGPLKHGKACAIGHENKQIILTPVPKKCVPGRQNQIEPKQKAENNKENDGQFLNHTVRIITAFVFFSRIRYRLTAMSFTRWLTSRKSMFSA